MIQPKSEMVEQANELIQPKSVSLAQSEAQPEDAVVKEESVEAVKALSSQEVTVEQIAPKKEALKQDGDELLQAKMGQQPLAQMSQQPVAQQAPARQTGVWGMLSGVFGSKGKPQAAKQISVQAVDSIASRDAGEDKNYNSAEEVDSDELDGEMDLSDDESQAAKFRAQTKKKKESSRALRGERKYRQEIDTNVFNIQFATLKGQAELATGDPTFCTTCRAVFNIHSKVEEVKEEDEKQIWTCEFCCTKNVIEIDEEERPQTGAVNYIVEAAAQVQDKKALGKKDISVVFCIDQSGSMCVS